MVYGKRSIYEYTLNVVQINYIKLIKWIVLNSDSYYV